MHIDDSLNNRDNQSRHNYKSSAPETKVCQGCSGDPEAYKTLVGEDCHACKGSGTRRS